MKIMLFFKKSSDSELSFWCTGLLNCSLYGFKNKLVKGFSMAKRVTKVASQKKTTIIWEEELQGFLFWKKANQNSRY